ncbi:MAG TPA: CHRD domain-containing protein [Candidatus Limnocylindrales bacterium]|nr:CHRD domain-containing protein [Candidatus Limnocylindrales bacterium]
MRFRRYLAAGFSLAVALALAAALAIPTMAAGGRTFMIELTGAAEAPGPGDPDGSGTATIVVNPGTLEVCYDFTVTGVAPLAAAHIHAAPAGEPGPVVIPTPPTSDFAGSGCVTVEDRGLLVDIIRNPDAYYFNVHNADFQPGALRGQLSD